MSYNPHPRIRFYWFLERGQGAFWSPRLGSNQQNHLARLPFPSFKVTCLTTDSFENVSAKHYTIQCDKNNYKVAKYRSSLKEHEGVL